ncbi:MAG TPA: metalloregulator ArsR/SmtB family transcription factor [Euzebyales bacterium]|nr:metalloregulator ArsR/SmtB family transcription factor [Euzebyales bacterium]
MARPQRHRIHRHTQAAGRTAGGPPTVFAVIGDPTRRRIMELLHERERTVGGLVLELNMAQPAVSKHLRTLREAGVAAVRADGRHRWYALRSAPLEELGSWLDGFGAR